MYQKRFLLIGGLLCAFSVILGAFGAHALKEELSPDKISAFDKGVRYQFMHAVSLILFSVMPEKFQTKLLNTASWMMCFGILFFSGSIYILTTKELIGIENISFIAPITPLGGLCFISGWVLFSVNVLKSEGNV